MHKLPALLKFSTYCTPLRHGWPKLHGHGEQATDLLIDSHFLELFCRLISEYSSKILVSTTYPKFTIVVPVSLSDELHNNASNEARALIHQHLRAQRRMKDGDSKESKRKKVEESMVKW